MRISVPALIGAMSCAACAARAGVGGPSPVAAATATSVDAPACGDTTAQTVHAAICRTWERFLASTGGHYRLAAFRPSPYWLASEQHQWRVYALALSYLPDGAVPELAGADSVPDAQGDYRVVTRFTSPDENNAMRSRVVRVTVFARRSDSAWVLENALPVLTRAWRRDTVGVITYVEEPAYPFDRGRAHQAAVFVDSLAGALGVPRPDHLTYYLTTSSDETYRIMGLETDKHWGSVGGAAQPTNYQLFSGIPSEGEDYRHELTHVVILPLMGGRTTYFVSEGIPTWLGGTTGMDFPAAARSLALFLDAHPGVALDSILGGHYPVAQFYPAAGVFVDMVHARAGTDGVKSLCDAGPMEQDLRAATERLLKEPWAEVASDWRRRVLSFEAGARAR